MRRLININFKDNIHDNENLTSRVIPKHQSNILKGLCICLTGLVAQDKENLHSLVIRHGGSYSRDLFTHKTSHLIAKTQEGQKFKEAVKCKNIEIVSPEWLYSCEAENTRVSTRNFRLVERPYIHESIESLSYTCPNIDSPKKINTNSRCISSDGITRQNQIDTSCNMLLTSENTVPNPLFSSLSFLLIGFGNNEPSYHKDISAPIEIEGNSTQLCCKIQISDKLQNIPKRSLLRLIRIANGTVVWKFTHNITHVVVNDGCEEALIKAISNFCRYHPNIPVPVSPHWIIASIYHRSLLHPKLYPPTGIQVIKSSTNIHKRRYTHGHTQRNQNVQRSLLFEGSIFLITLLSSPIGTVQFNTTEIEKIVTANGGIFLSQSVIDFLRKCINNKETRLNTDMESQETKRICYVVASQAGSIQNDIASYNDLLTQVSKIPYFQIIPVTPVWIYTCVSNNVNMMPDIYPLLFQPQSWFMQLLSKSLNNGKGIIVSVSGFIGSERTGIKHMLRIIGAEYTENLRISNSHLICKDTKGEKFKKAVEWGLYVISKEWLYHISQYGYGGKDNSSTGCEELFSQIDFKKNQRNLTLPSNPVIRYLNGQNVSQISTTSRNIVNDKPSKPMQRDLKGNKSVHVASKNLEKLVSQRITLNFDLSSQRKKCRLEK